MKAPLVELDQDHPGFRDPDYRRRRNEIAALARAHSPGTPAPDVPYVAAEHEVWRVVLEALAPLHQRYACHEFLSQWPKVGFPRDRIPRFVEVNETLTKKSGFTLTPVPGLTTARVFLESLGRGLFTSTQYIRHHSAPLYTPEPDVIHELVGHVAMLADPRFAKLNRLFGEAAIRADDRSIDELIRVYWFTLEFGAVRDGGGLRVIGAGILSSAGELARFERSSELRPFSVQAAIATPYDPTRYQDIIFVAESTDALFAELEPWLASI